MLEKESQMDGSTKCWKEKKEEEFYTIGNVKK